MISRPDSSNLTCSPPFISTPNKSIEIHKKLTNNNNYNNYYNIKTVILITTIIRINPSWLLNKNNMCKVLTGDERELQVQGGTEPFKTLRTVAEV